MQISLHRSDKIFVRIFRNISSQARSAASHPPPPSIYLTIKGTHKRIIPTGNGQNDYR